MSVTSVVNQVCTFLGGAYVAGQHSYRTPQFVVSGAYGTMSPVVRRAAAHFDDHAADFFAVPVEGTTDIGCLIIVWAEDGQDGRIAAGQPGLREISHKLVLNVFLETLKEKAEDLQDAQYAFLDALRARLYSDRTAGSGGFEAGISTITGESLGFQIGEVSGHGTSWFRWKMYPVETTPKNRSKTYIYIEFDAVELRQA